MEEYILNMQSLLENSKKSKKVKQEEAEQYKAALNGILNANGFCREYFQYLFQGVNFGSVVTLKNYIDSKDEKDVKLSALNELFINKLSKDNKEVAPVFIHLLALLLKDGDKNVGLVVSLLKRINGLIKQKNGKYLVTLKKIFKDFFVKEIDEKVKLMDMGVLINEGLTVRLLQETVNAFIETIDSIKADKNKSLSKNAAFILAWLKSDSRIYVSTKEETIASDQGKQDSDAVKEELIQQKAAGETKNDEKCTREKGDELKEIDKLKQKVGEYEEKVKKLKEEKENILTEKNREIIDIKKAHAKEISDKNVIIEQKNNVAIRLNYDISQLKKEILSLNGKIEEQKNLLASYENDNERLKNTSENKVKEFKVKLGRTMKIYKQDYEELKSTDMNKELGELVCGTLGDLLKALEREGIVF